MHQDAPSTTTPDPLPSVLPHASAGAPGPMRDALADRAAHYAAQASGPGTRRTYRSAWTHFSRWCHDLGREPLGADPELLAMYVVRRAEDGLAVSSIRVALAAIRAAHRLAGLPLDLDQPRFRLTLEGVVRSKGVRPRRQAAPAVPDILRRMLDALPGPATPLGVRARAMLLLGFAAALRRSELVGLQLGDVEPVSDRGLHVLVRRSKTDQHGRGQAVAVWGNPSDPALCPAAALAAWQRLRHATPDVERAVFQADREARPLFCGVTKSGRLTGEKLSDKAIARLVKEAAAAAGLDPALYSAHSLRAGLATAAGDAGAGLADLMRQTRHRSTEVALAYLRPADLWRNNVTEGLLAKPDGR